MEAGPVDPKQLPSELTQMTKKRSESMARPGPTIPCHHPLLGSAGEEAAGAGGEGPGNSSSALWRAALGGPQGSYGDPRPRRHPPPPPRQRAGNAAAPAVPRPGWTWSRPPLRPLVGRKLLRKPRRPTRRLRGDVLPLRPREAHHPPRPGQRAPGAPAGDEVIEPPAGEVLQDLGPRGIAVVGRVGLVLELPREEPADRKSVV